MKRSLCVGDLELVYSQHGPWLGEPKLDAEGSAPTRGQEAPGEPRPLVLIHGYSGCRQDFDPVLSELAELGPTLALDLRGHGESGRPDDPRGYAFAPMLDDLLGLLDGLGIPDCDLLGHSMGGMLALRFVLAHPERVASLILMNTSPRALELDAEAFSRAWRVAREAGMPTLQRALEARLRQDPARTEADRRCEEAWGEDYWAHHRQRFLAMDPEAYARLGPAMLEPQSLIDRLGEIRCPTLVLVGDEDREFRAPAQELARGIPGAVGVVLPGAAHHPQRENKAAWLDAVRAHLARARGLSRDRETSARVSRGSP